MTLTLNKEEYERLIKTLDEAGDLDTSPAVQKGLREGANAIKNAGKANLASRNKVKTGNLKRSMTIKVTRRKKVGSNYALSGFKRSSGKNAVHGGNHAYLVDRGTVERYTKKGYYRGSVSKGRPKTGSMFFTDAVDREGPRALDRLTTIIEGELKKLMG